MRMAFRLAAIALVLGIAAPGLAAVLVRTSAPMTSTLSASATADACSNNPGPYITLTGELSLGGLTARLIFRNNVKGTHTHTEDVWTDVVLIPAGEKITFAKQPSRGGVGGNPYIWVMFSECSTGNPLSDPIFLGRCVQGLQPTSIDFSQLVGADVTVSGGGCENNPGPFITLEGELRLSGICGKMVFTNNAKWTHTHEEDVEADIVILPAGESIRFAKQPPQGGVGGNPLIYLQFLDGAGAPLGGEIYVGKCVQLGR